MARPRIEISAHDFEELCRLQCTKDEICHFFGISEKTLTAWCKRTYKMGFSDIYNKKAEGGKISLRRMQFKLAEKNAAMAIFLGKNILGQRDKPEEESLGKSAGMLWIEGVLGCDIEESEGFDYERYNRKKG